MTGEASFDFSGNVVLVTGGGSGIGAGIAEAFAKANANVVITGRRLQPLEQMVAKFPDRISYVQMDVGVDEDRRRTIDAVLKRHGRLDVLVNNAMQFTQGRFEERTPAEISDMFQILLGASALFIHLALPHLKKTKGSVINISSVVGKAIPFPAAGMATYSAAKAGINQLTRALASELGPDGVRLNAIAPGSTKSEATDKAGLTEGSDLMRLYVDATPLGRHGMPLDIATVALFLASDAAGWVTGQVIDASGGWQLTP